MQNIDPVKYSSDEGFVEHKIELGDEDLEAILCEDLGRHADFDFDEVEVVNNRPMNIWLSAKCRKYVDPDAAAADPEAEVSPLGAEVKVTGESDGNPTGRSWRSPPRTTCRSGARGNKTPAWGGLGLAIAWMILEAEMVRL